MIDVTRDPFHLQDVGICELSIKNQNILEIVTLPKHNWNVDLNKIHVKPHALELERLNQLLWAHRLYRPPPCFCGLALCESARSQKSIQLHLLLGRHNSNGETFDKRSGSPTEIPRFRGHNCDWCRRIPHWWWVFLLHNITTQIWWVDKLQLNIASEIDIVIGRCLIWSKF
jgi:hypothetical protein